MNFLKKMWKKGVSAVHQIKSKFDKGGSYTGSPDDSARNSAEKPEQDADDL